MVVVSILHSVGTNELPFLLVLCSNRGESLELETESWHS